MSLRKQKFNLPFHQGAKEEKLGLHLKRGCGNKKPKPHSVKFRIKKSEKKNVNQNVICLDFIYKVHH